MPSRSLQMSMNLSSGLVAINLGSKRRTRVDLGLKNSRGLRNQDFTICEGEIVTKSRENPLSTILLRDRPLSISA